MTRHLAAALCAALFLSACGGGGGGAGTNPDSGAPATPATDVGVPIGQAVSAVIGAAGGELTSADGRLTVVVPAGAFATDQTVSIQEITNEAHGAKGPAFRILPEGLHTPVPMTLRFHYSDQELLGTALEFLSVAYQDEAGRWRTDAEPTLDTAAGTLSVQTTHFSDWSKVAGAQLFPSQATVQVGQTLQLQVVDCQREDYEDPDSGIVIPGVWNTCQVSPLDAYASSHWAVNGVEGGGGAVGTVIAQADPWAGKATYTAPATKPTPNVVSVSVQHSLPFHGFQLLVANITIEDAASSCNGFRMMNEFAADVSFDAFTMSGSGEHRTYSGAHSGRIVGTLSKINTGPSVDLWMTYFNPITGGQVSINDTHVYTPPSGDGYTETTVGGGAPHDGFDVPSFIALKVYYDTCTFDLWASYSVDGTVTHNGSGASSVIGVGGLYLYGQAIPPGQDGSLQGSLPVIARVNSGNNIDYTGYVPGGTYLFTALEGGTTARWTITPPPSP